MLPLAISLTSLVLPALAARRFGAHVGAIAFGLWLAVTAGALPEELQRCRDAKLVEAVNAEFMYFAAMNSTGCRLTPLGRHYWRMAQEGRI